jgi:hypothetical protein
MSVNGAVILMMVVSRKRDNITMSTDGNQR